MPPTFDAAAYESLEQQMLAAFEGGAPAVIVALDSVERLETATIGQLIALLRRARRAGGTIRLLATRTEIQRTLKVTGLDKVFELVEQRPERGRSRLARGVA